MEGDEEEEDEEDEEEPGDGSPFSPPSPPSASAVPPAFAPAPAAVPPLGFADRPGAGGDGLAATVDPSSVPSVPLAPSAVLEAGGSVPFMARATARNNTASAAKPPSSGPLPFRPRPPAACVWPLRRRRDRETEGVARRVIMVMVIKTVYEM
jgi:hypothetical protein